MAPVADSELLSRLVEQYDNEEAADNNNRRGSSLSPLSNAKFNFATADCPSLTSNSNANTAKQEYITANMCNQTGSQSHFSLSSASSVRAGSERPAAATFSALLSGGGTAARARSTGPVLQRKNVAAPLYESSYESIDTKGLHCGGNSSRWATMAEPLPPPRSALRQLDLAVKGMEEMWGRGDAADAHNRTRKLSIKESQKEEEEQQRQQRIQYDSITVLPASLGLPPPPPPLPRTRSFRQVGSGGGQTAAAKGTFVDVRASSAPPVSPLLCRKTVQSYR